MVLAVSPVSVKLVLVVVAKIEPFGTHEPKQRKILYPDKVLSSVEPFQEKFILVWVMVPAVNPVGVVGAWESTTTVVVAVVAPFIFTAVKVYIVVVPGLTIKELEPEVVLKIPGVMLIVSALETFHSKVALPEVAISAGLFVNEEIVGELVLTFKL